MVVTHWTVDVLTENAFINTGKVMFIAVSPATPQNERIPVAKMAHRTLAVSYTHLDVYKRQKYTQPGGKSLLHKPNQGQKLILKIKLSFHPTGQNRPIFSYLKLTKQLGDRD